jgi:hypothetical protein
MHRTIQTDDVDDELDLLEFTPAAGTYSTFNEAFAVFNEALFGAARRADYDAAEAALVRLFLRARSA